MGCDDGTFVCHVQCHECWTNLLSTFDAIQVNIKPQPLPSQEMDYSDTHQEENSTHSSPWATSPQRNPTFSHNSNTEPPSPSPAAPQNALPERSSSNDTPSSNYEDPNPIQAPSTVPNGRIERSDLPYRQQEESSDPNQSHLTQQQRLEAGQRSQQQRYHSNRPNPRHGPQYKLQGKVTGLERPGRKDPILRFDVYVWTLDTLLTASY